VSSQYWPRVLTLQPTFNQTHSACI
jgi:hypothetical protein